MFLKVKFRLYIIELNSIAFSLRSNRFYSLWNRCQVRLLVLSTLNSLLSLRFSCRYHELSDSSCKVFKAFVRLRFYFLFGKFWLWNFFFIDCNLYGLNSITLLITLLIRVSMKATRYQRSWTRSIHVIQHFRLLLFNSLHFPEKRTKTFF